MALVPLVVTMEGEDVKNKEGSDLTEKQWPWPWPGYGWHHSHHPHHGAATADTFTQVSYLLVLCLLVAVTAMLSWK